ncbi:MAG TPA: hypothetical protein VEU29_03215 [Actinomycetota bacterium]|nr:hypothetical protein [Actinomycetota bacterium]
MLLRQATAASTCDCATDPIACLKYLFVDVTQKTRLLAGQCPVRRAVFLKQHGCAYGEFVVQPDLPEDLRVGVFAGDRYPMWVRSSSDTVPGNPDTGTTLGMGVKLFDVPGEKLLEPDALTQDFVFQNFDVFFVPDAHAMCEFTYAGVQEHDYPSYLKAHPKTAQILNDMSQKVGSVTSIDYWSVLPSKFGSDRFVKYKLEPVLDGPPPAPPASPSQDYLADDLKARLLAGPVTFRFLVQFQKDPESMPLDDATVRWDESASRPVHVATLELPQQDVDATGQEQFGENLSFTAWHSLEAHAPVGSLQDARKVVYEASATLRRNANGIPLVEPRSPRP